MTLVDLAGHHCATGDGRRATGDDQDRWRLIAEFLEDYRHEPEAKRAGVLADQAPGTGNEQCGSRSTARLPRSTQWCTHRRASAVAGSSWRQESWAWRDGRRPAAEQGLPLWWLNKQASVYVAPGGDPVAPLTFDHPGRRVSTASPEHLLAVKTIAARRRDTDDLRLLVLADLFEELGRSDRGPGS